MIKEISVSTSLLIRLTPDSGSLTEGQIKGRVSLSVLSIKRVD